MMVSGATLSNIYPSDASIWHAERMVLYYDNMRPGKHIAVLAAFNGTRFSFALPVSLASSHRGTSFAGAGSSSRMGRRIMVASGAAYTNIYPSDESNRAAEHMVLSSDNMRAGKHITEWVHLA